MTTPKKPRTAPARVLSDNIDGWIKAHRALQRRSRNSDILWTKANPPDAEATATFTDPMNEYTVTQTFGVWKRPDGAGVYFARQTHDPDVPYTPASLQFIPSELVAGFVKVLNGPSLTMGKR